MICNLKEPDLDKAFINDELIEIGCADKEINISHLIENDKMNDINKVSNASVKDFEFLDNFLIREQEAHLKIKNNVSKYSYSQLFGNIQYLAGKANEMLKIKRHKKKLKNIISINNNLNKGNK